LLHLQLPDLGEQPLRIHIQFCGLPRLLKNAYQACQKLRILDGDNALVDFKLPGQFCEGMLAFNGFKGNLGLQSGRELTT
jgi:hypothetical protein